MALRIISLLFISVSNAHKFRELYTIPPGTPYLAHINDLPNVGMFKDAEHRGPAWYDSTSGSPESASNLDSGITSASDITSSTDEDTSTDSQTSSDASSKETREKKAATQMHRSCVPCPHEMMKSHKNIGIKWICGGYQRARRTFKSDCMMRYRNCQDGTMFVKLSDHRCGGSVGNATLSYHGKHWFYDYQANRY
ncbi:uncharacterized protein LOC142982073 [Anticarsia gemmatalis]|uniref:uncharacterized protein LOC142982073 n=1 Tax=Anticarsia gemmatalis TaxID=129554 RepID=UPI003F76D1C4